MEFFYGVLVGLLVGATVGVVMTAWIAAGRIADIKAGYEHDPYRR